MNPRKYGRRDCYKNDYLEEVGLNSPRWIYLQVTVGGSTHATYIQRPLFRFFSTALLIIIYFFNGQVQHILVIMRFLLRQASAAALTLASFNYGGE